MPSFLNMECPACGSVYTLSIEKLNILVLFECFECGQHNVYFAGHILMLDQDIMGEGTEREKLRHIVETIQLKACEFAGNVLKNVDRVINVNVEVDLMDAGPRNIMLHREEVEGERELSQPRLRPSVLHPDAHGISVDEVRDFVRIDLHLIDKRCHFDKFFGGKCS